jgi:hypothetical protein
MNWKLRLNMLLLLVLTACGGGGSDEPGGSNPDPDPDPVIPAPSAATLVFPDNNSECTTGEVVSDTRSRVLFQWTASENTDTYEVNLLNLTTTNSTKITSNENSVNITLDRGTPYEWFVVSRANGTSETASSVSWRFYNEGPGIANYAPFPAQVVAPAQGASINSSGTVSLEWQGNDVDDDLVAFEVYFGTDAAAGTLIDTISASTLEVNVTSGQGIVYYWKIVSRDSAGNTSESDIFQFRVN